MPIRTPSTFRLSARLFAAAAPAPLLATALVLAVALALLPAAPAAAAPAIAGDYLEARTADVYTGPCFANSQVGLVGKEAILAWRVRQGGWDGVPLAGLAVVAVVRAGSTLGDPFAGEPYAARSLIVVDQRADAPQRRALEAFARVQAGELLDRVVAVEARPIEADIDAAGTVARLEVAELAAIETRPLNHHDHVCGNEIVYYPPLTASAAEPAVSVRHAFTGTGLGKTWAGSGQRNAFVGTFAR